MFDIGSSELLLIVIVAVVVIGPKDLPRVLYKLGQIIGKGRAMTRHFRSGIDEMIRQAEMEEMEKKWAAENARIMAQNPSAVPSAVVPPAVTPGPDTGSATGSAIEDAASHAALSAPATGAFDPAEMAAGSYEVGPDSESARAQEDAGKQVAPPAPPPGNGPAA